MKTLTGSLRLLSLRLRRFFQSLLWEESELKDLSIGVDCNILLKKKENQTISLIFWKLSWRLCRHYLFFFIYTLKGFCIDHKAYLIKVKNSSWGKFNNCLHNIQKHINIHIYFLIYTWYGKRFWITFSIQLYLSRNLYLISD